MTEKIEQEFYKCFGIEPRRMYIFSKDYEATITSGITDRILLELICRLNSICGVNCTAYEAKNIKDLKEEILLECLSLQDEKNLQYEIQQLFEEDKQWKK